MQRKIVGLILIAFILVGCTSPQHKEIYSDECKAALLRYKLEQIVKGDGIQVVKAGDEVTLILKTDDYFYSNSNHLQDAHTKLNHIIAYINSYPVIEDIQVKGFTDNRGDYTRNLALSRAQAQAVASELWEHGLDSRLISADGYGCHNPYGFKHLEIFFRFPPPDNVFH
jgi:outer membrane protein OmpA-like peptidoglycan-associated protein